MDGRKLLKHELEERVIELEKELTGWKKKYDDLSHQYELLDKQNTALHTHTDVFERIEDKLNNIHTAVNEFQKPTITGLIYTFLDSILFNKPVIQLNNSNRIDYSTEEEEDEEEDEEEEDEDVDDIVIEPPTPNDA